MSTLIDKLLCDNLKSLKPYESARRLFSGGQDWLNANESPIANDYSVDASNFNRYPDCQPESLIEGYAAYAGVENKQTLVSRGADEGIELLIRAFCTPGRDRILICPPTYGMYAISAETFNVGVEKVPLKQDFSLDVEAICAFKGKVNLVFICSPNNPTGTLAERQAVTQVIQHFADSALVVIDEAYIEFSPDQAWAGELAYFPNLVILRTLSKAFALAGLRCGFTLASEEIIGALLKVIAPYPVSEPVAQIASSALAPAAIERMQGQVQYLQREKARLCEALVQISEIELVGDSGANFVLFRHPQRQALMAYLVNQGMLIRDQSKQPGLNNCLRVTVGNQAQNERVITLINQFSAVKDQAV